MDFDQIKGKVQSGFGKAEQAAGEAVGSEDLSNDGVKNQAKGAVTETWGNVKDAAQSVKDTFNTKAEVEHDRARDTAKEHATNLREKIANTVDNAKNAINEKLDSVKDHEAAKREEAKRSA